MKRAVRRQLWLSIGVLALLGAAGWQLHSDRAAAPGTLLALQPDRITRVTLQIGDAPPEQYVKRDEHWWRLDHDTPTRADDRRVAELARITAAPVQGWRPADSYDPAKIGLSPPQARLELDGQTLLFGGATAIGHEAYVQAGARIGIVSLRYLPRSAQSLAVQAQ